MTHIFISYSRQDQEFAGRVAADLAKLGADIWIDLEDIPIGVKWSTAIQQGLKSSEMMIVIISPASMGSTNVEDEWQYFLDQKKPLIPVLWKPAEVHFQLSRIEYIDFHTQNYGIALRQLHSALRLKGAQLDPISEHDKQFTIPPEQPRLAVRAPIADLAHEHSPQPAPTEAAQPPAPAAPGAARGASRSLIVGGIALVVVLIAIGLILASRGGAPVPTATRATQPATSVALAQQSATAPATSTTVPTAQATSTLAPTSTTAPTVASTSTVAPTVPPTLAPTQAATSALVAGSTRTDSKGVSQVWVPSGCFQMGANQGRDKDARPDEEPQHQVCLTHGYWLDQYEVTNDAYLKFIEDDGYKTKKNWSDEGWAWLQANRLTGPSVCTGFTDAQQPQVCITWYEADAYARWRGGRLPTEAEWEYAARGPNSLIYPWGPSYQPGQANINSDGTKPVGTVKTDVSWVGAYDLAGNVFEWTHDWYDANYYKQRLQDNPIGPASGRSYVARGGSWKSIPSASRASARNSFGADYRAFTLGFRIVSAAG